MKIFLDFDDTLFDTTHVQGKFLTDMRAAMQAGGWTQEQIAETAKLFSGSAFDPGRLYHYRDHMGILEEKYPHGSLRQALEKVDMFMQDLHRYVFPEVVPALEKLRKEDIVMVTYGDDEFQQAKISASGIGRYVSDIIVVGSKLKLEAISDWMMRHAIEGEKAFFVDDKEKYFDGAAKNRYGIITILMDRNGILGRGAADYRVRNLDEAVKIISDPSPRL